MHTGPMKDSDGTFQAGCGKKHVCHKCKRETALCEVWDSKDGGYEDYRYTCTESDCGYVWWVDGIDS